MTREKPQQPRSECKRCGHSSQWHQQNAMTMKRGHSSYEGASCQFPGCECAGAVLTAILPVRFL